MSERSGWRASPTHSRDGTLILKWGIGLCSVTAFELLDIDPSSALEERIRIALEAVDDVRVSDLHVWSLGRGARSCVVTVVSAFPREAADYRDCLAGLDLAHLTVEVRRCREGHPSTAQPG